VRDRLRCTLHCVESLIDTSRGRADIYLFDNASDLQLTGLLAQYNRWLEQELLAQLVINRPAALADAYWSKNFSWRQFLELVSILPAYEREYLVMVDNDTIARPGWIDACLGILHDTGAVRRNVRVVSPYDGPPDPTTDPQLFPVWESCRLGGQHVDIRPRISSRFLFAEYDFWRQWPAPTYEKCLLDGRMKHMPTDWYYWQRMREKDQVFAVVTPPICQDPPYRWPSARLNHGIGPDA